MQVVLLFLPVLKQLMAFSFGLQNQVRKTQKGVLLAGKSFCGQKNLFGLNCQAVLDCHGGFLDISILYDGSSSHRIAFEESKSCYPQKKNKFGLNCQAVLDCHGRFLDISILYDGSSSHCIVFEESKSCYRLEYDGLLAPGLFLFGNNAYLNAPFLATLYTNVSRGPKDDYNFSYSQLCIFMLKVHLVCLCSNGLYYRPPMPHAARHINLEDNCHNQRLG
jgi:hypothetical protein